MLVETKPEVVIKNILDNHKEILDARWSDVFFVLSGVDKELREKAAAEALQVSCHDGVTLELEATTWAGSKTRL